MPSAGDSYVEDRELIFQLHLERPTIPYVDDVVSCLVYLFTRYRMLNVNVCIPIMSIVPWTLGLHKGLCSRP